MFLVRFLGGVEIENDGISRPYAARRYSVLLALLALNPRRAFSRSEIVSAIWPDSDEESGRASLRTALSALRQILPENALVTAGETVALAADVITTDVGLLEQGVRQLSSAVSALEASEIFQRVQQLDRGSLLPGRYDDWIVAERSRVVELMRTAQTQYEILHRTFEKEWPPEAIAIPPQARLPTFSNRFVGREAEVAAVCSLINNRACRVITIAGTGGIGKTRLAVEVVHSLIRESGDTAIFIQLAACADGEEILTEVGRALTAESNVSVDWQVAVRRRLGTSKKLLIVLDNVEHLIAHGAAVAVRRLLDISPGVLVLATSRQLLGIEGERVVPLRGLTNETDQRLFVDQAQLVQPDFEVSDENRAALALLCQQLEGIPLAIELCAAWIPVLTPQQILGKMTQRFSLLKSRRTDVSARHRSLHAALEWGCPSDEELLAFFLALSVFRGGFSLEAAEAVCGSDALEHLATLREQSLVVANAQESGSMRYRLLETIREFAQEKLPSADRLKLDRKHLAYYADFAASITPRLSGTETAKDFAALEGENSNFRVAIERGLDSTIDCVLKARTMIMDLQWFWRIRGHRMPLEAWLRKLFDRIDELPAIDRAWVLMDYAEYLVGDEAMLRCGEALALFEANSIPIGISQAHLILGNLSRQRGDLAGFIAQYTKAASIRAAAGDVRGEGYALADVAGCYFEMGDRANARALWERCREIAETLGDIGSLAVLDRAEAVSLLQDSLPEDAVALLQRAIATFRQKGETWNLMDSLDRYGGALAQAGKRNQAIEAMAEALVLAEKWDDQGRAENIRNAIASLSQTATNA